MRLGLPGVVRGVVVDTAFFTGNYPPFCSVEACAVEGYPSPEELAGADWVDLVPRSPLTGDTKNPFAVGDSRRYTHVRLTIHPDGGVARLRVHGEPVADPRLLDPASLDLAALENGATISGCSNMFYSSPANLISPGLRRGDGGGLGDRPPPRRRQRLGVGALGRPRRGAPGGAGHQPLQGKRAGLGVPVRPHRRAAGPRCWTGSACSPTPGTASRSPPAAEVTEVRMDVYPDGGMARLRLHGALTPAGRAAFVLRWFNLLPATQAMAVLAAAGPAAERHGRRPPTRLAAHPAFPIGSVRRLTGAVLHPHDD